MHTISLILEYWWLALWIVGVAIAFFIGGWRLALAVASLGVVHFAFNAGARRANAMRRDADLKQERRMRDGYSKIDDRGASRSDVSKRLRDGEF